MRDTISRAAATQGHRAAETPRHSTMLDLAGRGAMLIGTRRIGAAVARRLAREGVNLAISYRRSKSEAESLKAELQSTVERVCLVQGDVGIEEESKRMVDVAAEELGDLSYVVNLASDYQRTPFSSLDAAAWNASCDAAKGSYLVAVYAARRMMANPGPTRGHILLFSDWAARETPYRDYLTYLTSKAAIDFMTRAFAVELASHGILVNAIAPGPTMRPPDISEGEWQSDVLDRAPLRRESSADEIAEMVVTLLKSESITGETVRVDSGRHLAGPGSQ